MARKVNWSNDILPVPVMTTPMAMTMPTKATSDDLAKRFGAEDGYKYVNALLDRASKKLRPEEHG